MQDLIKTKTITAMKRRNGIFGMMGAGALAVLSLLSGTKPAGNMPQQMVNNSQRVAQNNKKEAAPVIAQQMPGITIENIGGIPLQSHRPNYGMSPKQYGMIVGSGGKRKSNRLRYSHNAKVKKRKNNAC